jgi:hypothetical protein
MRNAEVTPAMRGQLDTSTNGAGHGGIGVDVARLADARQAAATIASPTNIARSLLALPRKRARI